MDADLTSPHDAGASRRFVVSAAPPSTKQMRCVMSRLAAEYGCGPPPGGQDGG